MLKEIKLSSLTNVIPKVNKKEPPRSINNDLTPFFFTSMFYRFQKLWKVIWSSKNDKKLRGTTH